jgi:hypothetical protein
MLCYVGMFAVGTSAFRTGRARVHLDLDENKYLPCTIQQWDKCLEESKCKMYFCFWLSLFLRWYCARHCMCLSMCGSFSLFVFMCIWVSAVPCAQGISHRMSCKVGRPPRTHRLQHGHCHNILGIKLHVRTHANSEKDQPFQMQRSGLAHASRTSSLAARRCGKAFCLLLARMPTCSGTMRAEALRPSASGAWVSGITCMCITCMCCACALFLRVTALS